MVNATTFVNIPDGAINGDKISGGTITAFSSTGIEDLATKKTLTITDGRIVIDSIRTNAIEGNIRLAGGLAVTKSLSVQEDSQFEQSIRVGKDVEVAGEIRAIKLTVDVLNAKVTNELKDPLVFSYDKGGIDGKGIVYKQDADNYGLFIYRQDPNRIFTNLDIDLYKDNTYKIDGTTVITTDTLGPSIVTSSLRKVGRLQNLTVGGNVNFNDHIFYSTSSDRFGIGTDSPSAAFSLVDSGVEVVVGSLYDQTGNIGTFTSNDFGLVTDGVQRLKITRTGAVIFGDSEANNADVTVFGKLYVKELIVDQRQDRTAPLEFKATAGSSNYGRGMIFTGGVGPNQRFVLSANPDQFFSSEHLNLGEERGYLIGGKVVLSANSLGKSVTESSLTRVGTLTYLRVDGEVNFSNIFKVKDGKVLLGECEIDNVDGLKLIGPSVELKATNQSIKIAGDSIIFGNKDRPMVNAVVNGTLSVGVQNIGTNAQFEVGGNVRFANKLFSSGNKAPTTGTYRKGDIVWNDDPKESGYVGWICVRDGNPGVWRGFGLIGVE